MRHPTSPIAVDVGSGVLVAFVNAAYSLSFALLIFSGPLSTGLSSGVAAMVFSAGLSTLAAATFSSYRFAIAGQDTATMAVLSAMVAGISASFSDTGRGGDLQTLVVAALALTTLATGLVLFAIGALKLGLWMRYIPYPVMGGFLAAAGCLLIAGGLKVATGSTVTLQALPSFIEIEQIVHILAALAFALIIVAVRRRLRHFLAMPVLLIVSVALFHVALAVLDISVARAREETWLLPAIQVAPDQGWPWTLVDLADLRWRLLVEQSAEVAAAAGVTAVAILLTATGLEVSSKTSLDLNRELRVGGVSNMVLGLCGGIVSNLTLNRTVLNVAAGARSRVSGLIAGLLCIALSFGGSRAIAYVPTPVLSGLILCMGFSLISDWVVDGWRRLSRLDYVLVLAIMTLIVTRSYLEGIVLGVVASCLIFAIKYSRVRIVKHRLNRQQTTSSVERSPEQQAFLLEQGERIHVLWIQGYLFFGTANRLLDTLWEWVVRPTREPRRFLLLDFREVTGIDSSAAFSFLKLRNVAEKHNVRLIFSAFAPGVRQAFAAEGLWDDRRAIVLEFPTLDLALEWAEERLLKTAGATIRTGADFDAWLEKALGGPDIASRFRRYLEAVRLEQGAELFAQGDQADALYFVRSGRVSVILDRPQAQPIRLRSMTGFTVVGEMGLYRDMTRTAAVVADVPSDVYRLSKSQFRRMERTEPDLSSAFHALIVRILADRLSFATNEIAELLR